MPDDPKRRELEFRNLDEVVADVEQLAKGEVRTTGTHSFSNIVKHLALTHDMATGKTPPPSFPWYMKLGMVFMRKSILADKPLTPGFKLPPKAQAYFWPEREYEISESIAHLKESVEYFKSNGPLEKHPVFGVATTEQNLRLNCRHAALHLSFVHPAS